MTQTPKRIFIFLGHPDKTSFNGALADAYEESARAAGHEVRRQNIGDMVFDPILHKGYKEIQNLEPDLVAFQEHVRWSNHFVLVTPIWWSNIPAILKGLFDRVWLPGFGYRFRKDGLGWMRLLKGKSARVITTSDSHPLILVLLFGGNLNNVTRGILRFSGFAPVRKTWFYGMRNLAPKRAESMLKKIRHLGVKGV